MPRRRLRLPLRVRAEPMLLLLVVVASTLGTAWAATLPGSASAAIRIGAVALLAACATLVSFGIVFWWTRQWRLSVGDRPDAGARLLSQQGACFALWFAAHHLGWVALALFLVAVLLSSRGAMVDLILATIGGLLAVSAVASVATLSSSLPLLDGQSAAVGLCWRSPIPRGVRTLPARALATLLLPVRLTWVRAWDTVQPRSDFRRLVQVLDAARARQPGSVIDIRAGGGAVVRTEVAHRAAVYSVVWVIGALVALIALRTGLIAPLVPIVSTFTAPLTAGPAPVANQLDQARPEDQPAGGGPADASAPASGGQSGQSAGAGPSDQTGKAGDSSGSGQSGEQGQAGQGGQQAQGQNGPSGQAGQSAQSGQAGQSGQNGQQGQSGQSGQSGRQGQTGQSGQAGQSGQQGASGQQGQGQSGQGQTGQPGQSGQGTQPGQQGQGQSGQGQQGQSGQPGSQGQQQGQQGQGQSGQQDQDQQGQGQPGQQGQGQQGQAGQGGQGAEGGGGGGGDSSSGGGSATGAAKTGDPKGPSKPPELGAPTQVQIPTAPSTDDLVPIELPSMGPGQQGDGTPDPQPGQVQPGQAGLAGPQGPDARGTTADGARSAGQKVPPWIQSLLNGPDAR